MVRPPHSFPRQPTQLWRFDHTPSHDDLPPSYQMADLSAFILCLNICYCIGVQYVGTYDIGMDTFPAHYVCRDTLSRAGTWTFARSMGSTHRASSMSAPSTINSINVL